MKIAEYVNETRTEMKHVSWPTRKQATFYTILVILVSVAVAVGLGVLDYVFSLGLEKILIK